eukprot:TRINITY_DN2578_c0_g2_i5.p1 TRINITY_DN2578_c0_g2~~TRINITY_DN2578_c0_g2_i5.p1  ORF type:complete len:626 (-),score=126.82 TRINITY_DN2578_c0_g2_i5:46-1923(-)
MNALEAETLAKLIQRTNTRPISAHRKNSYDSASLLRREESKGVDLKSRPLNSFRSYQEQDNKLGKEKSSGRFESSRSRETDGFLDKKRKEQRALAEKDSLCSPDTTLHMTEFQSGLVSPGSGKVPIMTQKHSKSKTESNFSQAYLEAMRALQDKVKWLEQRLITTENEKESVLEAKEKELVSSQKQLIEQSENYAKSEGALRAKVKQLEGEISELNRKLLSLQRETESQRKSSSLQSLEQKAALEVLSEKISSISHENRSYAIENETLKKSIASAEGEKLRMLVRENEMSEKLRTLEQELREHRTVIAERFRMALVEKDELQRKLKIIRDDFIKQLQLFQREITTLETDFRADGAQLKSEMKILAEANRYYEERLRQREEKIERMQHKNKELKSCLEQLRRFRQGQKEAEAREQQLKRLRARQLLEDLTLASGDKRPFQDQPLFSSRHSSSVPILNDERVQKDPEKFDLPRALSRHGSHQFPVWAESQILSSCAQRSGETTSPVTQRKLYSVTPSLMRTESIAAVTPLPTSGSQADRPKTKTSTTIQARTPSGDDPFKSIASIDEIEARLDMLKDTFKQLSAQYQLCEDEENRATIRSRMTEITLEVQKLAFEGSTARSAGRTFS